MMFNNFKRYLFKQSHNKRIKTQTIQDQFSMNDVVEALHGIRKELAGFTGGYARSIEHEVTKSVAQFLNAPRDQIAFNVPIILNRKIVGEADGLVFCNDFIAVIEAKSQIRSSCLSQLKNTCEKVQKVYGGKTVGFVGSPVWDSNTKEQIIREGFVPVVLNGSRFNVVVSNIQSNPNDSHNPKKTVNASGN